eukprot:3443822-Amphidinium_carterae.1
MFPFSQALRGCTQITPVIMMHQHTCPVQPITQVIKAQTDTLGSRNFGCNGFDAKMWRVNLRNLKSLKWQHLV